MTIKQRVDKMCSDFSVRVNEAILKGDFRKISQDKHTVGISVFGESVEIWNVKGQKICLYRIMLPNGESLSVNGEPFMEEDKCREILRETCESDRIQNNKRIFEEIESLKKQLVEVEEEQICQILT